jgi:hypothetical protein
VNASIYHVDAGLSTVPNMAAPNDTDRYGSIPVYGVFAVQPGANTFELRVVRSNLGDGIVNAYWGTGNAMYSPFGSTGGATP